MKRDDPRHGEYAGYLAHYREGEKACKACREARNAYVREHRSKSNGWREQQSARSRAITRLINRHRAEYQALYVEERTNDHVTKLLKDGAA